MNKSLATFGLLVVAGALSFCDLCGPGARSSDAPSGLAPGGLVSAAYAAPVPGPPVQVGPPAGAGVRAPMPAQAAAPRTVTLAVQGMTCGGCVLGTRRVLTRLSGVTNADVRYERGTAVVTYDPRKVTVAQIVAAVKTLGYTATPVAG